MNIKKNKVINKLFKTKTKQNKEWEILLSCEGAYDWLVLGVWLNERNQKKVPFGALQCMCGEWCLFGKIPKDFNPDDYKFKDIIKINPSIDVDSIDYKWEKLKFPWGK